MLKIGLVSLLVLMFLIKELLNHYYYVVQRFVCILLVHATFFKNIQLFHNNKQTFLHFGLDRIVMMLILHFNIKFITKFNRFLPYKSNSGLHCCINTLFQTLLNVLLNFGVLVAVSSASAITEDTLLLVHSSIHYCCCTLRHSIYYRVPVVVYQSTTFGAGIKL